MDHIKEKFHYIPERISGLGAMACNLWWSWHPEARMLFKMLDRASWKINVHNPVRMLLNLRKDILDNAAKDPKFLRHYDAVLARFKEDMIKGAGWFHDNVAAPRDVSMAYFSAEYGLHHSMPFYAGGLGFLAGDFLKECSDLDIPVVGVGFMYPEGYIRQMMTADGWQVGTEETMERENTPISRVFDHSGARLTVKVPFIEPPVYVEVWQVRVGRVPLYLIDTDIEANDPWNRAISARLYIGNPEQRLRQEVVLGIGGTAVLNVLGIKPSLLHLNEGHSAFAILERIREKTERGTTYKNAFEQVRSTTVFTTHTPVPAGHDVFSFPLVEKYFNSYWPSLGLSRDDFLDLGVNPKDPRAGFNMTAFAMRASAYCNGVSRKHGEVTRRMWRSLWPGVAEEKIPVDYVTNGIHVPTWIEPKVQLLLNNYLGPYWLPEHDNPALWQPVKDIPDRELWLTHYRLKVKLINTIREKARQMWLGETPDPRIILASGVMLDPNALTLGFARRFATYKRATLIFHNIKRLKKMLKDRWKPVQIIFAGKAHPDDDLGKRILQQVFNAAKDPSFFGRIAFVEDYDEQLAQYFVHGVDIWLNNPLPPFEACGTSGMKASLNGVPNLSILDGWWIEGCNGRNGWGFGAKGGQDRDLADSKALYDILEKKVIPAYFRVDGDGIPHDWVKVMKEAMISVGPRFSARRMVKEYVEKFYKSALKSASEQIDKP